MSHLREVNETLFAASVPMKKEADAGVLPAHVENGGDKSGTTCLPHHGDNRAGWTEKVVTGCQIFCPTTRVGLSDCTERLVAGFAGRHHSAPNSSCAGSTSSVVAGS